MGKIVDLENIAALENKLNFAKIVNTFCGRVCTHLIQDRGHTRTSPAGHGGAAGRPETAEALWESPYPTSIFPFVSRLSK